MDEPYSMKNWKTWCMWSENDIKDWVNSQRESGKKRTYDDKPFQFDNLLFVEQDYKKRKTNGGRSSDKWMYHYKHLYGCEWDLKPDPENESHGEVRQHEYDESREANYKGYSWSYYRKFNGKLLPWHEVKACNGIVWKHDERFLTENANKCNYVGPSWDRYNNCVHHGVNYAIPTEEIARSVVEMDHLVIYVSISVHMFLKNAEILRNL